METLLTILQYSWPLIGGILSASVWLRFFRKKERRLFKNIKRPITIIGTTDKSMEHESRLLERAGFFNISSFSSDARIVDLLNGSRLAIIGYTPGSSAFKGAFDAAKNREIPVIVYAGAARITPSDMRFLESYSHYSMCNTPLRLISDVFALMSTYPEDK